MRYAHIAAGWLVFIAALVGFALYDAPVAAGIARIMLATVAGVGLAARSTSAGTASATAGLPADPDAQDTRPGTGRGPR